MGFGVIESVLLEDLEHYEGTERGFIPVPQPPIHKADWLQKKANSITQHLLK